MRSYAQEIGEEKLFTDFGRVHHLIPIKEEAGIVNYSIFVHGTGPEEEKPNVSMSGSVIIEIEIEENPLLEKLNDDFISTSDIPTWIKNNAGWWAEGQIDDNAFVQGIQFLVKEDVIQIPDTVQSTTETSQEIPAWIKNNADWWSQGLISDDDFLKGIEFMVKNGIIKI